jgi:long-chain fatty acid transport protein
VTGGYRSSAVPDATIDAASPDGDRIVAGVGGSYRFNQRYMLLADAAVQKILTRTVVGSDYDLGNGEYSLTIAAIGAHLQVSM